MIKVYTDGLEFVKENKELIDKEECLAIYFYVDSKIVNSFDANNYAIKVSDDKNSLIAIKVFPYGTVISGDISLVEELVDYLVNKKCCLDNYLTTQEIGDKIKDYLYDKYQIFYYSDLSMDYMKCDKSTADSSSEVIKANLFDSKEILLLTDLFRQEAMVTLSADEQKIKDTIDDYRIIKQDGKIVAMAKMTKAQFNCYRIANVYTLKDYRNKSLARKIVNSCKNEIINKGFIATLNVDKHNPISNHLYKSIGFEKITSLASYCKTNYQIVKITNRSDLIIPAAKFFSKQWKIDEKLYVESMEAALNNDPIQQWYLCLDGEKIIGGLGEIENDFHDRKDCCPNVVAVYVLEQYRNRNIARRLLDYVVKDNKDRGISPLYLITMHESFYERYGWQLFGYAQGEGDSQPSRLYVHY